MVPTKALGRFSVKLWKVLSTELLPRKSIVGAGCLLHYDKNHHCSLHKLLDSFSSYLASAPNRGIVAVKAFGLNPELLTFLLLVFFGMICYQILWMGRSLLKKKKSHKRNLHKIEFYFTIDIHLRKLYPWERKKNLSEVVIYIFLNYGREYSSIFIRLAWSL